MLGEKKRPSVSLLPRPHHTTTQIMPFVIAPARGKSGMSSATSGTTETSTISNSRRAVTRGPSGALHAPANKVKPLEMHGEYGNNRGKLDIWMLGITIVIGGQYFSWNAGLAAGFVSYFIAYLLVAAAYLTLCCCTAEITGALPFAGGAYGLSRCTLGFFPGFIIGCCEALEYIAYVATTTLVLADMIVSSVPSLEGYEPLIWALFYVTALWFHIVVVKSSGDLTCSSAP